MTDREPFDLDREVVEAFPRKVARRDRLITMQTARNKAIDIALRAYAAGKAEEREALREMADAAYAEDGPHVVPNAAGSPRAVARLIEHCRRGGADDRT